MKVGFIGGDLRQLTLLKCFEKMGFDVLIYGYDDAKYETNKIEDIYNCDVIVFPLPSCNGEYVSAPMSKRKILVSNLNLPQGKLIFYAGSENILKDVLIKSDSVCIDYLKNEELTHKNAISTAEGAVEIAINETPITIFKSNVLIIGFGKVAKACCRAFGGLGAKIYVTARRNDALAEAYCCGYEAVPLPKICSVSKNADIIINTVPSMIINKEVLKNIDDNSIIIDLASKPGGVDFQSAKLMGKRVIWALSLPGKIAPITSGEIIFDTIYKIIKDREGEKSGT